MRGGAVAVLPACTVVLALGGCTGARQAAR